MNASDNAGNKGLIDFAWISASRAFTNSSAMHRSKEWHLFQNQVDREWFGEHLGNNICTKGIALDTNVQNNHQEEFIGFWNVDGLFTVPGARNRDVFEARRFACDGNATIRRSSVSPPAERVVKPTCVNRKFEPIDATIAYANSARLGALNPSGERIEIDADDDSTFDGWTWTGNLTGSFNDKPDWIFSSSARRNKKCDD